MTNTQLETARRVVALAIQQGGLPSIHKSGMVQWRGRVAAIRIMELAALNDDAHTQAVREHLEDNSQ